MPRYFDYTMVPDTNALAAGDVVSITAVLTNFFPRVNALTKIQSLVVLDLTDQKALLSLVFLDANQSLGALNAAPDIDDTEALAMQGVLNIAAADYLDVGASSIVTLRNVGLILKPAAETRDLYMASFVTATSTPTYGANGLRLRFGLED